MTVNRRAIVSVAIGLGLVLGGCSPSSPSRVPPPPPPKPRSLVAVTVSSVTKTTIEPNKFSYTFRLKLTEYAGVPSTVTTVDMAFDSYYNEHLQITGDQLGENRRLTANGTLDLEVTFVPPASTFVPPASDKVGNEASSADVEVYLTDDNGNSVFAAAAIDKL
jgi:hypothetical protein